MFAYPFAPRVKLFPTGSHLSRNSSFAHSLTLKDHEIANHTGISIHTVQLCPQVVFLVSNGPIFSRLQPTRAALFGNEEMYAA